MSDIQIKIVVVDAAPLITLAAGNSLDYLLYSRLPVIIPDAVFYEATASTGKIGAEEIIEWYRHNHGKISIEPTEIWTNEVNFRLHPEYLSAKNSGEQAAMEVIRNSIFLKDNDKAILLTDDRDVRLLTTREPDKIILLTTFEYLQALENAKCIQSADYIFDRVKLSGRNPPRHELFGNLDVDIKKAVEIILMNAKNSVNKS